MARMFDFEINFGRVITICDLSNSRMEGKAHLLISCSSPKYRRKIPDAWGKPKKLFHYLNYSVLAKWDIVQYYYPYLKSRDSEFDSLQLKFSLFLFFPLGSFKAH